MPSVSVEFIVVTPMPTALPFALVLRRKMRKFIEDTFRRQSPSGAKCVVKAVEKGTARFQDCTPVANMSTAAIISPIDAVIPAVSDRQSLASVKRVLGD